MGRRWLAPVGMGALAALGVAGFWTTSRQEAEPAHPVPSEPAAAPGPVVAFEPVAPANPDLAEGARAKREEGRVAGPVAPEAALERTIAESAGVMGAVRESGDIEGMFGNTGLDANLRGGVGGLIGAKGATLGSGGVAARGSGLGGGGSAEGIGGLGTRGRGAGASGYGRGGGSFGAVGAVGRVSVGGGVITPSRPLSQDWVHPGTNPTELAAQDGLSTFSIDVDTASYTQARRQIQAGVVPPPASVRTEEFINYFRYAYPEPERGRPFSVTMDGAEHPWRRGHHLLRVGIKGAEAHHRADLPVHLTFLVDVSGSMRSADKLPLARQALHHLVDNLEEGDTVAIATYAGGSRVVLRPTDVGAPRAIHDAIDGLRNGGGTDMESGMRLAYDMALATRVDGEESRVIVLSDGDANIGATSHQTILEAISGYADQGITLSTVGFGTGNYRDALMEQLADEGDGNYTYIDSMAEARRVFGEDLGSTLRTIARDVKIQVAFDPDNVIAYTLLGYENRAIADEDFRNDAVDAGEVGAGHTVTALYDVVLRDQRRGALATVQVRHKPPGPDAPASELAVDLPARAVDVDFARGGRDLRRAFGAAAFAEKLRGSDELAEVGWDELAALVARSVRPGDDRDAELVQLIEAMATLDARPARPVSMEPVILGALDRTVIDEVILRHRNQIRYCYQRELTRSPSLAGELVVKAVIARDGTVSSATEKTSTLGSSAVSQCVIGRFMRMQFPHPTGGGIVIVSYPFRFDPEA